MANLSRDWRQQSVHELIEVDRERAVRMDLSREKDSPLFYRFTSQDQTLLL